MRESVGAACLALHHLPQPVIAAELFVHRGLSVNSGGSCLLPRLVGLYRAKELVPLGARAEAAEPLRRFRSRER